jgi:hypothetical protein
MTTAAEARQPKPRKPKVCKHCRTAFVPSRPMQSICNTVACAAGYAATKREQKVRKEIREAKAKAKTRSQWLKETQAEFNKWVRTRDAGKPCICCGKPLSGGDIGGAYDCGHYRSVGSAPHLRFHPDNAHAQNKQCNRWGAGRAVDYRLGLIARIGLAAVEALEADQESRKYSIEDLKAIKATYIAKRKQLEKERDQ